MRILLILIRLQVANGSAPYYSDYSTKVIKYVKHGRSLLLRGSTYGDFYTDVDLYCVGLPILYYFSAHRGLQNKRGSPSSSIYPIVVPVNARLTKDILISYV